MRTRLIINQNTSLVYKNILYCQKNKNNTKASSKKSSKTKENCKFEPMSPHNSQALVTTFTCSKLTITAITQHNSINQHTHLKLFPQQNSLSFFIYPLINGIHNNSQQSLPLQLFKIKKCTSILHSSPHFSSLLFLLFLRHFSFCQFSPSCRLDSHAKTCIHGF